MVRVGHLFMEVTCPKTTPELPHTTVHTNHHVVTSATGVAESTWSARHLVRVRIRVRVGVLVERSFVRRLRLFRKPVDKILSGSAQE